MKTKSISLFMAICLLFSTLMVGQVSTSAATDEAVSKQLAQSSIGGSAVLHCFNWSYNSIKENLADIAAAGYTAVQTSPVQKPKDYNASWTDVSGQWWKLYQPLNLHIDENRTSWLGTKAELKEMCSEADKYGIKVIADIVVNHLGNNGTDGGTYAYLNSGVDSELKNSSYFHTNNTGVSDTSRYTMTQYHLGMPDLNTGNSEVQQKCLTFLKECVDCGIDGFRFDAAKHIELPNDPDNCKSNFWPYVINGIKSYNSNVFCYGEILGGAGTDISNYTTYMAITDNYTGDRALDKTYWKYSPELADSTYYKGASAADSVLWVESHDTYMGSSGSAWTGNTSGVSDDVLIKAWAIVGSRADSTSLFFARPSGTMGTASTDTTWKDTAVAEVNKFKNYFDGTSEYLAYSGTNVAYNERGTGGVVITKLDGAGSVNLTAHTMASGTYTDQVTGNTFTVANGKISGTVGSTGVAVVYNPSENEEESTEATSTTADKTTNYYLIGNMTDWKTNSDYQLKKNDLAETEEYYITVDLETTSQFKIIYSDGTTSTWYPSGTNNNYGQNGEITSAGTYTIYFRPNKDGGSDWFNSCIYAALEEETTEATETTTEEETDPEETTNYYLIGNMTDWQTNSNYQLKKNDLAETEEYYITVDLETTSQFKIIYSDGTTSTWYPSGTNNNYGQNGEITSAGTYTIYFRPNKDGGSDWFNSCIYAIKKVNEDDIEKFSTLLFAKSFTSGEEDWYSWTWADGVSGKWVKGTTLDSGYVEFENIYADALFIRVQKGESPDWSNGDIMWNKTENLTIGSNDLYVIDDWGDETLVGHWTDFAEYNIQYICQTDGANVNKTKVVPSTADADIKKLALANYPSIKSLEYEYTVDSDNITVDGTNVTVPLTAVKKDFKIYYNGEFYQNANFLDKVTVKSDSETTFLIDSTPVFRGQEFTFYVSGTMEITTDDSAEITNSATIVSGGAIVDGDKIVFNMLATAKIDGFKRMGVVFAKTERSSDELKQAVLNVTEGTAASNSIGVHNSQVTKPNVSGQYQFIFNPYMNLSSAVGKLYFYTFAVDGSGEVILSDPSVQDMDAILA